LPSTRPPASRTTAKKRATGAAPKPLRRISTRKRWACKRSPASSSAAISASQPRACATTPRAAAAPPPSARHSGSASPYHSDSASSSCQGGAFSSRST
jgi:hypothetical protein